MIFLLWPYVFISNVNAFVFLIFLLKKILKGYGEPILLLLLQLTFIFFFKRADDITSLVTDTTLLIHFFGKKGKAELNFEDFYR